MYRMDNYYYCGSSLSPITAQPLCLKDKRINRTDASLSLVHDQLLYSPTVSTAADYLTGLIRPTCFLVSGWDF